MPSSRFAPTRPNRRDDDRLMLPSRLLVVRQHFPDRRLTDVRAETHRQLEQSGFAARLQPGARVAIGVGSRGIANIATIVQSVVRVLARSRDEAVHFSLDGKSWCRDRRRTGGRARAFRNYRTVHGLPHRQPRRRRFARRDRRWHRSLHGCRGARGRRRDDRRTRQVAHDLRGPARKRPHENDGHRPGEVCRRAEVPHARAAARPRARHPHGRAAGAAIGKDDRRPGDPRRRAPQHGEARCRAGRAAWNSATKRTSRSRNPGCRGCRAISTSSSSTRWARTSAARAWTRRSSIAGRPANTTPGRDCRRSGGSSFATWIPRPMATRSGSAWRT